jgi:putative ABC transport system permease protein
VLVGSQFAISAALIIATTVVYRQLNFLQTKDLGFDKDHVITTGYYGELHEQYESFRNGLLASSNIKEISRSSRVPSGRLLDSQGSARVLTQTDTLPMSGADLKSLRVDYHFVPTYGLELAAGRNFHEEFGTDKSAFILNETAVENIGWDNAEEAIGKRILYGGQDGFVVGVVKDFNFESLHQDIQPMIFYNPSDDPNFWNLSVKVDGANVTAAISELEKAWKQYLPQFPFDYQFVDERFGRLYENEQRQSRAFIGFALLAIFIACLGLFGLTAFVARQRTKEIGIRKVLGASTSGIVGMLSKDFLKPVLIALLIASPVAYYFMDKWLQDFAYRIHIDGWVFVLAGAVATLVAFATVSFQSVRAALANPVDSLRSE